MSLRPTLPNEPATPWHVEVEDLYAGYGKATIVQGVSVRVRGGQICAIVGPNGAGKSTLLKACFGLVRVFAGKISYLGSTVGQLATEDIARRGVSYIPQLNKIFPRLTVEENLQLGGYIRRRERDFKAQLEIMLSSIPQLRSHLKQRAGTLSGGEQTMLAVARGVMSAPEVLLLDEPTAALSPMSTGQLWEYIERLKESGMAILLVEQRTRDALTHADWGYVLNGGKLAREGSGSELLQEDLGALFLGGQRHGQDLKT